jgi:hypothetical protein
MPSPMRTSMAAHPHLRYNPRAAETARRPKAQMSSQIRSGAKGRKNTLEPAPLIPAAQYVRNVRRGPAVLD